MCGARRLSRKSGGGHCGGSGRLNGSGRTAGPSGATGALTASRLSASAHTPTPDTRPRPWWLPLINRLYVLARLVFLRFAQYAFIRFEMAARSAALHAARFGLGVGCFFCCFGVGLG